jgi:hypothetical protein
MCGFTAVFPSLMSRLAGRSVFEKMPWRNSCWIENKIRNSRILKDDMTNIYKDNWKSYRDLGLIPFPGRKDEKAPPFKYECYENCSPTQEEFLEWEKKYPDFNIWVLLNDYLVVESDNPAAEKFIQTLGLSQCPTAQSGKRSLHYYFKNPLNFEFLNINNKELKIKLEVRTGFKGMFVPPSIHPETKKPYKWLKGLSPWEVETPLFPIKVYEKLKALTNGGPRVKTKPWQANSYVEGERNILLFKYACSLRAKRTPLEEAEPLVLEKAKSCDPPAKEKEALRSLKSAYQYPEGISIPEYVLDFNERYFVTQMEGKTFVCWDEFNEELKRHSLKSSTFGDFKNFHSNQKLWVGEKGKEKQYDVGTLWLNSEHRRQYEKVVFSPEKEPTPNCYNLWKGFSVEPTPGDWSLYEKHLREVVCQGNKKYYQYLIQWLANTMQHPGSQGWAAVVLRGERGSGKGIVAQVFGTLFKQHFLQIFSSKHLVGHFNSHLRDCVFLFVDEAFWAGDKQGEGTLKGLITERVIVIEEKHKNIERLPNRLHIMMATNHEWAVPAGPQERRFFVLDVGSEKIGDRKYFKELLTQMEGGGKAALLYDLQKMDLSNFDVQDVPDTLALNDQKRESMTLVQQYWYERLLQGTMPYWDYESLSSVKHYIYREQWTPVAVEDFYGDYVQKMQMAGHNKRGVLTMLGMRLKKLLPSSYPRKHRIKNGEIERRHSWEFPSLKNCREHFEKTMKMKVNWGNEELKPKV